MALVTLDLQNLNGQDGFVVNGETNNDNAGRSIANAGDINGDGFDDFIIGAPQAGSSESYGYEGRVYVIFGQEDTFVPSLSLADLDGTNGFSLSGVNDYDNAGASVDGGQDVNGDGLDDLIIGTNYADSNAFVVFGSNTGFDANLALSELDGTNGFSIQNAYEGGSIVVSFAGDINGDGFSDIAVSSPYADNYTTGSYFNNGRVYIIFGGNDETNATFDLNSLDGTNGFQFFGLDSADLAGQSVRSIGDVNGDGFDDLIIGAPGAGNYDYGGYQGRAYVVFGQSDEFDSTLSPNDLDGTNGFTLLGINEYDNAGASVGQAGDINGDGIDDFLVSAPNSNGSTGNSYATGTVYVVYGKSNGFSAEFDLSTLNGDNGFAINGINNNDNLGQSVSGAFDFNGDGVDDIILGAPNAAPNGSNSGEAYVILGGQTFDASINLATFDGVGFILQGVNPGNNLGAVVSGLGDINGDNLDDVAVGIPNAGVNSSGQGIVVFGTKAEDVTGTNEDDILNGGNLSDRLAGRGGDDILRGRGGNDTLLGGIGDDTLLGNAGDDSLLGAAGNDQLLGESGNDRVNAGAGNDLVDGGAGNDTVLGGGGSDRLLGDIGSDDIRGNGGQDRLFGEEGDDTLDGGTGDDTVQGGQGNDLIKSALGNNRLNGNAGNDRFQIKRGSNQINGGDGVDTLDYSKLARNIVFNLANAIQKGNLGTDTISNIEHIIGSASSANEINGSMLLDSAINVDLSNDVLTLLSTDGETQFSIQNFANVVGTDDADVIRGNALNNAIDSGGGDDTIVASSGNDTLDGGSGEDLVDYSSLGSVIMFDVTGSVQKGTQGTDLLSNIEIIVAGEAGSTIDGSSLVGVGTKLQVDLADEQVTVIDDALPSETVFSVSDFNQVIGGENDDEILGNSRSNTLEGGNGNDFISGRGGADTLIGVSLSNPVAGPQVDTLIGGNGGDLFVLGDASSVFYSSDGDLDFAEIGDFRSGRDRIQLNGSLEDYIFSGGASNTSIFLDQNSDGLLNPADDLIATFTGGGFQTSDLSFV